MQSPSPQKHVKLYPESLRIRSMATKRSRGSSAGVPQRTDPAAVFRQRGHIGQRQEVGAGPWCGSVRIKMLGGSKKEQK